MRSADQVAGMLCPVCQTGLTMSDRQGIEIDYCPQCRGVWLDRGELDKIIERSAVPAQSAPPPQARQPRPDDRYHDRGHGYDPRYKRKKSWLEEIFD